MKSLGDFLAQNHKGMINGRRWWAVFVEGAGNEEQPWDKHPEISKCTVLRRNDLSVFHLSPCPRLNISFESCHQKALKTVDPSEQSKETSPVINYKIISQGYQANFPLQNSSSSTQTSSHPQYSQYLHDIQKSWEVGGKTRQGCYCTWQSSGRWDRNPKGRGRKGSALGTLQGSLTCCRNPSTIPEPSIHEHLQNQAGAGTVPGRRMIIQSNLLPCQAAVCSFQLIKPKDWGEFHKLNP